MVVRSTVKPHEKSPEEASEDRTDKDKMVPKKISSDVTAGAGTGTGTGSGTGTVTVTTTAERAAPSIDGPSRAARPTAARPQSPRDAESGLDGCEVDMAGATAVTTSDEDLPAADGGVD
jgi:hypothetical protein